MGKKKDSRSSGSSKKAKKTGSNVFDAFSQKQVAEFKEGFQFMDRDKDGIIGKNDLRACFDDLGKIMPDKELDDMLADAPGPINFTMLLTMFAERQSGQSDDDEVVVQAFRAFEQEGNVIDSESFRKALMTFGDKFSAEEVDDAFDQMDMDDNGMIDCNALISMLTAGGGEEGEGEAA